MRHPFVLAAVAGIVIGLVQSPESAAQQMYRWVDKDGRVHYTQTPPTPAQSKSIEKRAVGGSVVESGQVPYATSLAAKNFPVTIYTGETCGAPCNDAKALLTKRGVPFREVVVVDDRTRDELKRVSGGEQVPVMSVGKDVSRGFEEQMWHTALDAAGYPASGPALPQQGARRSETPAKAAAPAAPPASEAPRAEASAPAETARPGPYAPKF